MFLYYQIMKNSTKDSDRIQMWIFLDFFFGFESNQKKKKSFHITLSTRKTVSKMKLMTMAIIG